MIPVPYQIQHNAWAAAYELREAFSDRLSIEQNIRMEVLRMYAPERLGWGGVGEALALFAMVVEARV